jgi:adenine C2-methylase RlmN of 23S rRNA A2503 and tRNA A37
MERFVTKDNNTVKYIHEDGSETAFKFIPGCSNNPRNKYSIYISVSSGCPLSCKMCYLTTKKYPYNKLNESEISRNVIDALMREISFHPEMKEMYAKLCFMGMGDALLVLPDLKTIVKKISSIMTYDKAFCKGIDGIDIATTMPKIVYNITKHFEELSSIVPITYYNPDRDYISKPFIRVFYSLHSICDDVRSFIIPKTMSIKEATHVFDDLKDHGIGIIYHYLLLDGINNSDFELKDLCYFMQGKGELRILRYNKCPGSEINESKNFTENIELISLLHDNVKIQHSAGSEIRAACGQFLSEQKILSFPKV